MIKAKMIDKRLAFTTDENGAWKPKLIAGAKSYNGVYALIFDANNTEEQDAIDRYCNQIQSRTDREGNSLAVEWKDFPALDDSGNALTDAQGNQITNNYPLWKPNDFSRRGIFEVEINDAGYIEAVLTQAQLDVQEIASEFGVANADKYLHMLLQKRVNG
jgi:5-hydroxyisourate hydrolase-like protein (transthyretin family)